MANSTNSLQVHHEDEIRPINSHNRPTSPIRDNASIFEKTTDRDIEDRAIEIANADLNSENKQV